MASSVCRARLSSTASCAAVPSATSTPAISMLPKYHLTKVSNLPQDRYSALARSLERLRWPRERYRPMRCFRRSSQLTCPRGWFDSSRMASTC